MDTQPLSMRESSGYGYGTNEHARRRNETEADLQTMEFSGVDAARNSSL